MLDLSVIICAHNPRTQYLRRVLDALRDQTLPQENWELLLIDNLSSVPLVEIWDLTWHPHSKHLRETELGISAARRRGIKEGQAKLIVFIDDDNVLDKSYLSDVLRLGAEWPCLGAWGSGKILPEFEVLPSEPAKQFLSFLALRETPVARWGNTMAMETTPWGAGMCLRRQVAERYIERYEQDKIQITGRKGTSLASGEDNEISHVACELGLGTGVFPELKLIHLNSRSSSIARLPHQNGRGCIHLPLFAQIQMEWGITSLPVSTASSPGYAQTPVAKPRQPGAPCTFGGPTCGHQR